VAELPPERLLADRHVRGHAQALGGVEQGPARAALQRADARYNIDAVRAWLDIVNLAPRVAKNSIAKSKPADGRDGESLWPFLTPPGAA
jgi:hypothetical protein